MYMSWFTSKAFFVYLVVDENCSRHVGAIFKWLAKSSFYLECKNYALFLPEVKLLGCVVFEHGVYVSPNKVSIM